MIRRQARIAAALATVGAAFIASADARGAALRAYRLEQAVTLQPSQRASFSLACDAGDAVTEGVWNVEQGSEGVAVLEARAFSGQSFRFTLRDDDDQPAQLHLYLVCQDAVGQVSPAGAAVTTAPGVLRCRAGTILVAPGFGPVDADPGLVTSTATRRTARLGFAFPQPPVVSGRCIRATGTRFSTVTHRGRVPAGQASAFATTCPVGSTILTGTLTLAGASLTGQVPRGRARTITLTGPGPGDGDAVLGARCLHPR